MKLLICLEQRYVEMDKSIHLEELAGWFRNWTESHNWSGHYDWSNTTLKMVLSCFVVWYFCLWCFVNDFYVQTMFGLCNLLSEAILKTVTSGRRMLVLFATRWRLRCTSCVLWGRGAGKDCLNSRLTCQFRSKCQRPGVYAVRHQVLTWFVL